MRTEFVDIYQEYGFQRGTAPGGSLTAWIPDTPSALRLHRKRPAVLILPGGGYAYTSEREAEPIALRFLARGFVAFVLEYSCAPHRYPVALRETAMAIRYIRENAYRFGVDPAMVAAIGFSAGGHLCGMLGTLYDSAELADIGSAQMLRPDALGLNYPVAVSWGRTHEGSFQNLTGNDGDLTDRLSLEKLVRPDMPPVFLWHTRDDASVPCRNSLILAQALENVGVDFAMHIYHRGRHGLSTADEMVYPTWDLPEISGDVPEWLDAEIRFFRECGLRIKDMEEKT